MTASKQKTIQKISNLFQEYLKISGVQGAALSVVQAGKNLCTLSGGFSSVENHQKMKISTLFGAGSITKTITALLFLLLEEEGSLSLDDPVCKYLPEFDLEAAFLIKSKGDGNENLLIRHLLSHSSGIPELGYSVSQFFRLCGVEDQGPFAPDEYENLYAALGKAVRTRYQSPGKKFLYSNANYIFLARIAERVSTKPFQDLVSERIFFPLGMSDSTIGMPGQSNQADIITGYIPLPTGPSPVPLAIPRSSFGPGGLITNIKDLGHYMGFLLGDCNLPGMKNQTFSQTLWQKLIARDGVPGGYYGLGWFIQENIFPEALIYHGGDILFSGGMCALLPLRRTGIVIGQNAAGSPQLFSLVKEILRTLINPETIPDKKHKKSITPDEISGVYQSQDNVYTIEALFDQSVLKLRLTVPGMDAKPELPFAVKHISDTAAIFGAITYPPAERQDQCIFIRGGNDNIWMQYENYVLKKSTLKT